MEVLRACKSRCSVVAEMSLRRWGNLGLGEAGKVEMIAGFLVCGEVVQADLWRGGGEI